MTTPIPKKQRVQAALDHLTITPEQSRKAALGSQVGGSVGALSGTATGATIGTAVGLLSRGKARRAVRAAESTGKGVKGARKKLADLKSVGERATTGAFLGAGSGTALGGGSGAAAGLYSGRPGRKKRDGDGDGKLNEGVRKAFDATRHNRDNGGRFAKASGMTEAPGSRRSGMSPEQKKKLVANGVATLGVAGSVADAAALKAGWAESKNATRDRVHLGRPGPMTRRTAGIARAASRAKYVAGKGSFPLQVVGLGAGLGGSYFARQAGKSGEKKPIAKGAPRVAARTVSSLNNALITGTGVALASTLVGPDKNKNKAKLHRVMKSDTRESPVAQSAEEIIKAWTERQKKASNKGAMIGMALTTPMAVATRGKGMRTVMSTEAKAAGAAVAGGTAGGLIGAHHARPKRKPVAKSAEEVIKDARAFRYDKKTGQRRRNAYTNPTPGQAGVQGLTGAAGAMGGLAGGALAVDAVERGAGKVNGKATKAVFTGRLGVQNAMKMGRAANAVGRAARDPRALLLGSAAGAVAGTAAAVRGTAAVQNRGTATRQHRDNGGRFAKSAASDIPRDRMGRPQLTKHMDQARANDGKWAAQGRKSQKALDRHKKETKKVGALGAGLLAAGEAGGLAASRSVKRSTERSALAGRVAHSGPNSPWLNGPLRVKAQQIQHSEALKAASMKDLRTISRVGGRVYGGAMLAAGGAALYSNHQAQKKHDAKFGKSYTQETVMPAPDVDELFAKARAMANDGAIEKFEQETTRGAKTGAKWGAGVGGALSAARGAIAGGALHGKSGAVTGALGGAAAGAVGGGLQWGAVGGGVGAYKAHKRIKRQTNARMDRLDAKLKSHGV